MPPLRRCSAASQSRRWRNARAKIALALRQGPKAVEPGRRPKTTTSCKGKCHEIDQQTPCRLKPCHKSRHIRARACVPFGGADVALAKGGGGGGGGGGHGGGGGGGHWGGGGGGGHWGGGGGHGWGGG